MKKVIYLFILIFISCEEVVVVDLPSPQNLIVLEGWLTNNAETQTIRLSQSNGFSEETAVNTITNAEVVVQSRTGSTFRYAHSSQGFYQSETPFAGVPGEEYRVRVRLNDSEEIRSGWERMEEAVLIESLTVESFLENNPDNSNQQFRVYYPKVNARDPEGMDNFYRWVFFKNGVRFEEPESITIQDDRFFDGNLIPNNFEAFAYDLDDEIIVQFQSITEGAYEFLQLLKSQTTTLGTSTGTTPAIVTGNLKFEDVENTDLVLGYFGTIAISSDTVIVTQ